MYAGYSKIKFTKFTTNHLQKVDAKKREKAKQNEAKRGNKIVF